jgi:hypothetical protein
MSRRGLLVIEYTCPKPRRASCPRDDNERGKRRQGNQGPGIVDGFDKGNLVDERGQHGLLFGVEQRGPECVGWNAKYLLNGTFYSMMATAAYIVFYRSPARVIAIRSR